MGVDVVKCVSLKHLIKYSCSCRDIVSRCLTSDPVLSLSLQNQCARAATEERVLYSREAVTVALTAKTAATMKTLAAMAQTIAGQ